jgi:hypothetical protein
MLYDGYGKRLPFCQFGHAALGVTLNEILMVQSPLLVALRSMVLCNIENLVLRARSEFDGFAGKDCERLEVSVF